MTWRVPDTRWPAVRESAAVHLRETARAMVERKGSKSAAKGASKGNGEAALVTKVSRSLMGMRGGLIGAGRAVRGLLEIWRASGDTAKASKATKVEQALVTLEAAFESLSGAVGRT